MISAGLTAELFFGATALCSIAALWGAFRFPDRAAVWGKAACWVAAFYVLLLSLRDFNDYFDCRIQLGLMREYASHWVERAQHREPLWRWCLMLCGRTYSPAVLFVLSAMGYVGFTLWALRRLTPRNPLLALLLFAGSMFFLAYGAHAVRNGLACSMVLAVIGLLAPEPRSCRSWLLAAVLALLAVNIHTSVLLPLAAFLVALFLFRRFGVVLAIWAAAILFSLSLGYFGDPVSHFFASLNLDYRFQYYAETFLHGGNNGAFRWDFVAYSALPVLLGIYVIYVRKVTDRIYSLLLRTYLLANTGWVLFIHISISDRFAYLSWFMWPLLWAYPLLQLRICSPRRQFILLSTVCLGLVMLHYL